jgi:hypothetical protein
MRIFFAAIFICLLIGLGFNSCSSKPKISPIAYNDSLVVQQIAVVDASASLQEVLDTYNKTDMQTMLGRLQGQINLSLAKSEAMGPYKDDNSFKDATLAFIRIYQELAQNEYRKAVQLLSKPDTLYAPEDEAVVEKIYASINQVTAEATLEYEKAQQKFAEKNEINLKTEVKK